MRARLALASGPVLVEQQAGAVDGAVVVQLDGAAAGPPVPRPGDSRSAVGWRRRARASGRSDRAPWRARTGRRPGPASVPRSRPCRGSCAGASRRGRDSPRSRAPGGPPRGRPPRIVRRPRPSRGRGAAGSSAIASLEGLGGFAAGSPGAQDGEAEDGVVRPRLGSQANALPRPRQVLGRGGPGRARARRVVRERAHCSGPELDRSAPGSAGRRSRSNDRLTAHRTELTRAATDAGSRATASSASRRASARSFCVTATMARSARADALSGSRARARSMLEVGPRPRVRPREGVWPGRRRPAGPVTVSGTCARLAKAEVEIARPARPRSSAGRPHARSRRHGPGSRRDEGRGPAGSREPRPRRRRASRLIGRSVGGCPARAAADCPAAEVRASPARSLRGRAPPTPEMRASATSTSIRNSVPSTEPLTNGVVIRRRRGARVKKCAVPVRTSSQVPARSGGGVKVIVVF